MSREKFQALSAKASGLAIVARRGRPDRQGVGDSSTTVVAHSTVGTAHTPPPTTPTWVMAVSLAASLVVLLCVGLAVMCCVKLKKKKAAKRERQSKRGASFRKSSKRRKVELILPTFIDITEEPQIELTLGTPSSVELTTRHLALLTPLPTPNLTPHSSPNSQHRGEFFNRSPRNSFGLAPSPRSSIGQCSLSPRSSLGQASTSSPRGSLLGQNLGHRNSWCLEPPSPHSRSPRHSAGSVSSLASSIGALSLTLSRRRSTQGRNSVQIEELDLSMYGKARDDELRGTSTIHSRGRLAFSVVYDVANQCLVVNILRATGLLFSIPCHSRRSSEKSSSSVSEQPRIDTSIKVCVLPHNTKGQNTKITRGTTSPVYDESFCFTFDEPNPANSDTNVTLKLWVYEFEKANKKHSVGVTAVNMKELTDQAGSGDLVEFWRDVLPEKMVLSSVGKLLLSMQYDYKERVLRAAVVELKDLRIQQFIDRSCDPSDAQGSIYVKITLISENKVMSRRKTPIAVMADRIKFYDVQKFSLQILMLENVTLVFTLYVKDSKGISTMIGRTNVGSITYSTGAGLAHWNDMMTSTSTATEMWHDLL